MAAAAAAEEPQMRHRHLVRQAVGLVALRGKEQERQDAVGQEQAGRDRVHDASWKQASLPALSSVGSQNHMDHHQGSRASRHPLSYLKTGCSAIFDHPALARSKVILELHLEK